MSTTFWLFCQRCQIFRKFLIIFVCIIGTILIINFQFLATLNSSKYQNYHKNDFPTNQVESNQNGRRKLLSNFQFQTSSIDQFLPLSQTQQSQFNSTIIQLSFNVSRTTNADRKGNATNPNGNVSIQLQVNLSGINATTAPISSDVTATDLSGINATTPPIFTDVLPAGAAEDMNCILPAINEFPSDGLTRIQRQNGWIVMHIFAVCYCFWILAIVCQDYFVPAIELLCQNLQVQKDVIGATFMAAAASSPELFINCVGTFVTEGDLGVGTIVGSAIFNILIVPAICGVFAGQFVDLDWWPITRDCLMYCVAVLCLIGILFDGKVMWYEALLLIIIYIIYIVVMYFNDPIASHVRKLMAKCEKKPVRRHYLEVHELTPLLLPKNKLKTVNNNDVHLSITNVKINDSQIILLEDSDIEATNTQNNNINNNNYWTFNNWILIILRWPIKFLLRITIPDCQKCPKFRLMTLTISICWIGTISYLIALLITFIGDTFNIPDSVMGLTILAAGMSIPETVSSVIVTKQGHASMGLCNSIGSNIFDILLCLGIPWLIKSTFLPATSNEHWILLNSSSLTYSSISLLVTLCGMYLALILNQFQLNWKTGVTCILIYIIFVTLASLLELNVFFIINLPICNH